MAERNWDSLSADYRSRLVGAGKTQQGLSPAEVKAYYEGGGNLGALRRGEHGRASEGPHRPTKFSTPHHPSQYRVGSQDLGKPGSYATKDDALAALSRATGGSMAGEVNVVVYGQFSYKGSAPRPQFITISGRAEDLAETLESAEFLEDALEEWYQEVTEGEMAYNVQFDAASYLSIGRDQ
jgi:hypothetical protein